MQLRGEDTLFLHRPISDRENSRAMVHNNVAVYAHDQLRQRAAWALSQVLVVGADNDDDTERWLAYYDIFVRHAFGSFRDVLREVSYSSLRFGLYAPTKKLFATDGETPVAERILETGEKLTGSTGHHEAPYAHTESRSHQA